MDMIEKMLVAMLGFTLFGIFALLIYSAVTETQERHRCAAIGVIRTTASAAFCVKPENLLPIPPKDGKL